MEKRASARQATFSHARILYVFITIQIANHVSRFGGWRALAGRTIFSFRRIQSLTAPSVGPEGLQANLSQKTLRSMKHFPSFYVFIGEERIS
jgi:hypothetical protein